MLAATLFALSLAAPSLATPAPPASVDAQVLVEAAVLATSAPSRAPHDDARANDDDARRLAQGDAPPPPPPPPMGTEPPPPPSDTPPPSDAPPPSALPPSSAVPPPDVKVEPAGLNPVLTTALQFCVGCVTASVVSGLVGWIPVLGSLVLVPAAVAVAETFLGDFIGQKRGAMLWPFLGAVASTVIGGPLFIVGGIALAFGISGTAFAAGLSALVATRNPLVALPFFIGGGVGLIVPIVGGVLLFLTSNALTPALVYALTSEDKHPGDTGGGFPGLISPNHPTPPSAQQVSNGRRATLVPAMAY